LHSSLSWGKVTFLYDATLFSHYKAKGIRAPAQAPSKTHVNKSGKQYSTVGNIYVHVPNAYFDFKPLTGLMFIYCAKTSAINKTKQQQIYYTAVIKYFFLILH
jgi:hypothetical protein